jgi:hypothetical protein
LWLKHISVQPGIKREEIKKRITILLMSLSLLVAVPVFNTGCPARTQQKTEAVAYRTLSAVDLTVSTALKVYAEAYVDGNVTVEQHNRVANMHDKYRVAMSTAIAAARLNLNAPASVELTNIADALVNLIKEVL